jgi:hypothetical protein
LVAAHRSARGLDDAGVKPAVVDQVAASLALQGLAMHLSGIVVAAMVLDRTVPIARSENIYVVGRGVTFEVAITEADLPVVMDDEALAELAVREWVDGHLRRLCDDLRATVRIGEALLWSNVAAAVSSNLVFLDWWERSTRARLLADAVLRRGTPALGSHCRMHDFEVDGRVGLRSDRRACCLAIKIPGAHVCPTCPLVGEEDRVASTRMHVGHLHAVLAGRASGPPRPV